MAILNADGQEVANNGPWWARSIYVVGPITIIALGLVWLLAFDARADLRAAASVGPALAEHQKHTEQLHNNIENYMRVQLLLMRQICSSSAKNADERRSCFQP